MAKRSFVDQMQRTVEINFPPKRIVSIVPSQTELLFDLGLSEEIVGITKFCIHPNEQFKQKTKVGGTKTLDFQKIAALQPDLIIGNKEENTRNEIEQLMQQYPVWMSDINDLSNSLNMISMLAELTDKIEAGKQLTDNIQQAFNKLVPSHDSTVAYFIWKNPYMVAGSDTFIHHILEKAGFRNVFKDLKRYPEITSIQLAEAAPDLIFLSSEPYPFKEKHIEEFTTISPKSIVKVVDGELFSWYGSRIQYTPEYLRKLIAEIQELVG